MTPFLCRTCGANLGGPEMSTLTLAHFLGHIQDTYAVPELPALSREKENVIPAAEATPLLTAVIAAKVARLVGANRASQH